ncbi:UbiA family prenyltransferase [Nocardioides caeni]|uniref:Prenyltransferase n=1 Tax=Nocardioides caeni TaxID=574700 RepID=A0A4S8N786_9ACTN|nr:UbiA family prenyltransferase [Nocardioides caeni]THV12137.1 hypothetical protein E9934_12370 [Nocardioides caeni]
MAKKQRWRRGGSSGEDTTPAETTDATTDEPTGEDPGDDGALDATPGATGADREDETPTRVVLAKDFLDDDELADDVADDVADQGALDELADIEDEELEDLEEADEPRPLPRAESSRLSRWFLGGREPADVAAVQLLQAAHAKQAITTALAMGLVAAIAGREAREAGVVLVTVLVGQTILGWHNDIVDRQRDHAHGLTGKPLAMGRITPDTVWYAIIVATLLLVPLAITTGIRAGCLYLASVAVGMLGNVLLRTGIFSWWSWAVSFALLPAYLSYGGWGGQAVGSAPETSIVVLSALLGVGVHFMRSVWGLVADHEDGWTYLPLRLGLKLGATRLLALSTLATAIIAILLAVMGAKVGLSR